MPGRVPGHTAAMCAAASCGGVASRPSGVAMRKTAGPISRGRDDVMTIHEAIARLLTRDHQRRGHATRVSGHAPSPTVVPYPVMTLLDTLSWVHALGMGIDCEGCANDGEPGYCRGPRPSTDQAMDDGIVCHCGHRIVPVIYLDACGCSGPDGWHCPGEESQHWAKGEEPDAECGHCGDRPSDDPTGRDTHYPMSIGQGTLPS